MAQWKKVVVSGSGVAQLSNDASYLVDGQSGAILTGSFKGDGSQLTGVLADSIEFASILNKPTLVSGSVQVDITATTGYSDFSSSLAVDIAQNASDISTNASDISDLFTASGSFSTRVSQNESDIADLQAFSASLGDGFATDQELSNVSSSLAADIAQNASDIASNASDIATLESTTVTGGSGITTSGDLSALTVSADVDDSSIEIDGNSKISLKNTTVSAGSYGSATEIPTFTVDADGRLTAAGTANVSSTLNISGSTSGNDAVSLISDALTFAGNGGLTAVVSDNTITFGTADSGFVSASAFSSPSQGTVRATINGVQTDVDTGLQTSDSPEFAGISVNGNATVTGNLTVSGDLTYLNTTNTAITDKFILLNSGSANPDEGGFIIDEGSGVGHAFIFDAGDGRFGVNQSVDSATATTANSEAYVALVVDEDNVAHDVNDAEYQKRGNMKISSSDEIFIYV